MPLEGIITWLIAAVIIIVILVVLVHLLGHVFFILPEVGVIHPGIHQYAHYGDVLSAPFMHNT
jgi:hypothetical protein